MWFATFFDFQGSTYFQKNGDNAPDSFVFMLWDKQNFLLHWLCKILNTKLYILWRNPQSLDIWHPCATELMDPSMQAVQNVCIFSSYQSSILKLNILWRGLLAYTYCISCPVEVSSNIFCNELLSGSRCILELLQHLS